MMKERQGNREKLHRRQQSTKLPTYGSGLGWSLQLDAVITTLWLDKFLDFQFIPATGCVRWVWLVGSFLLV